MTKHKILFGVVLLIAVVSSGLNVVQVIKNKNESGKDVSIEFKIE